MPYYPITGSPSQYQASNGSPADGYYLKFYESGTSTPIFSSSNTTATDESGQEQVFDKIKINSNGYPINPSGGVIVPHVEVPYKIVLYKTAADANANATSSADWVIDGLSPGLLGVNQNVAATSSSAIEYIADPTAAISNVETKLKEFYSVKDFGAIGDGIADDSVAIATALVVAKDLYFPTGTYLCGGILIQTPNTNIHFRGNVALKANDNNLTMFKQTASDCDHTGTFSVNSNSKSGIVGMMAGPSDPTSTSVLTQVERNTLPGIVGDSGVTDLVVIMCGPKVSTTLSYTRNNVFPKVISNSSTRAVYFKASANATADIPRSNNIMLVEVGPTSQYGVDIECGSSNAIHALRADGCTIAAIDVSGVCPVTSQQNHNNAFLSGYAVNCAKDIINGNSRTQVVGFEYSRTNSTLTAKPVKHSILGNQLHDLFFGSFESNATNRNLPSGWTCSKISTGVYQITHSLGTTSYDVVATNTQTGDSHAAVYNINTNFFYIEMRNGSNSPIDRRGSFILWRY